VVSVRVLWVTLMLASVWLGMPGGAAALLSASDAVILHDAILADSDLADEVANRYTDLIAAAFNTVVTPTYWILKPTIGLDSLVLDKSVDDTRFSYVEYEAMSNAKRATLDLLFRFGPVNPNRNNVEDGITTAFGTASDNLMHYKAMIRVPGTRAQVLFGVGNGDGTTGNPRRTRVFAPITAADVSQALFPVTP
jgi:hypothetical protein